ncbi:hypothetical protein BN1708_017125, partial [Verticillium longisporum]
FEWFNFDAEIDFHGTKALLRQLFDVDAVKFNISGLADLIISQPTIGSTVKVDDKANDAYALMTVLNMHEHRDKPAFADLTKYIIEKAQTNEALAPIPELLTSGAQIWDLRTGSISDAYAYDHGITSMMFDARRIVSAAGEDVVKVYDKLEGRQWECGAGIVQAEEGKSPAVVEQVRVRDGYMVEGRQDGIVGVWTC